MANGGKGKAYVFLNDGVSWSRQAILEPSLDVPDNFIMFGSVVSLDGK